jgi:hypothetical protein
VPITLSMTTVGLYSLVATLIWGRLVFWIPIDLHDPVAFVCAVIAIVVAIALVGFLEAITVVRYRSAWAVGTALELPIWLICGFLVPLSALPGWVHPIAWALPPTWGVLRAPGGSPGRFAVARRAGLPGAGRCLRGNRCAPVRAAARLGTRPGDVGAEMTATINMTARAATMNSFRIFFRGGLTSYRALFNWITPWILIPTFIIEPVFQVLFFVFVGRTAGVGNDRFFLIGMRSSSPPSRVCSLCRTRSAMNATPRLWRSSW